MITLLEFILILTISLVYYNKIVEPVLYEQLSISDKLYKIFIDTINSIKSIKLKF